MDLPQSQFTYAYLVLLIIIAYPAVFAVAVQVYLEQQHHKPEKWGNFLDNHTMAAELNFGRDQNKNDLRVHQRQEQLTNNRFVNVSKRVLSHMV